MGSSVLLPRVIPVYPSFAVLSANPGSGGDVATLVTGEIYSYNGTAWTIAGGAGSGTVTSVSVTTANGVSAVVTNPTTTPNLTFTLGDITPTSVLIDQTTFLAQSLSSLTNLDISCDTTLNIFSVSNDINITSNTALALISFNGDVSLDAQGANITFSTRGSLRMTLDTGGTWNFQVGTIDAFGVGSAWTQWNVDNLRLDGNTLTVTNANANLLLDGNGTGFVQLNTSTSSQQFPKARPSALVNPLLTINQATGLMSWINFSSITPTITLTGDVTGSGTGSFATTIANNVVTNAKLAQMTTLTIKGNNTGVTANALDLSVAQVKTMLSLTGTNSGDQTITLTGDVTGSGTGSFATTIAANAITNAKAAQMATLTIKGNNTGITANPLDLTVSQTQAMLQDGWAQLTTGNLKLLTNTISATSGDIILGSNTDLGTNTFFMGSTNQSSIKMDGTSLLISPKITGAADVCIGSSSASGGNDADLRVGRLGLCNSDISATACVNFNTSGSFRTALNFVNVYTGSSASAGSIVAVVTDTGTGASFTLANNLSQTKLLSTSHTTNYTQYAYRAELGIDSTIVTTTGNYQIYAFRALSSQLGVGNASTSGGTFYRFGFIQDAITPIAGTPTSDKIVGAYFADSINTRADNKLYYNSVISVGTNPSGTTVTFGTCFSVFDSASSELRTTVGSNLAFQYGSATNTSTLPLLWPVKRTTVADAAYAALTTDQVVAYTSITASRIVTLPSAASHGTKLLIIKDESGSVTVVNTIVVTRAGADTIDGAVSATISAANGVIRLYSNGVSRWCSI